jgi:hypothetical protein
MAFPFSVLSIFLPGIDKQPFENDACVENKLFQDRNASRAASISSGFTGFLLLRRFRMRPIARALFCRLCSSSIACFMSSAMIALLLRPENVSLNFFFISSGTLKLTVAIAPPLVLLNFSTM